MADIHFQPAIAMMVAECFEKIRVNPGNFADGRKTFEVINYDDPKQFEEERAYIEEVFTPLVLKCKELGRCIRIGTNHGSLSARILSYYGDTPRCEVTPYEEWMRRLTSVPIGRLLTMNGLLSFLHSISHSHRCCIRGMVQSAFEFADICRKHDFHNFLFSMKASNPLVMVAAYRLLAEEQYKRGWDYPLHLGVTGAYMYIWYGAGS